MISTITKVLIAITFAMGLASCGPEKSQLDIEREIKNAKINEKVAEDARLIGFYEGEISTKGKKEGTFELRIYPALIEVEGQTDPVPVLQGDLKAEMPVEMKSDEGTQNEIIRFQGLSKLIKFSGATNLVKLVFITSLGPVQYTITFDGNYNGSDTISGRLYMANSKGNVLRFFDYTMTKIAEKQN